MLLLRGLSLDSDPLEEMMLDESASLSLTELLRSVREKLEMLNYTMASMALWMQARSGSPGTWFQPRVR